MMLLLVDLSLKVLLHRFCWDMCLLRNCLGAIEMVQIGMYREACLEFLIWINWVQHQVDLLQLSFDLLGLREVVFCHKPALILGFSQNTTTFLVQFNYVFDWSYCQGQQIDTIHRNKFELVHVGILYVMPLQPLRLFFALRNLSSFVKLCN